MAITIEASRQRTMITRQMAQRRGTGRSYWAAAPRSREGQTGGHGGFCMEVYAKSRQRSDNRPA